MKKSKQELSNEISSFVKGKKVTETYYGIMSYYHNFSYKGIKCCRLVVDNDNPMSMSICISENQNDIIHLVQIEISGSKFKTMYMSYDQIQSKERKFVNSQRFDDVKSAYTFIVSRANKINKFFNQL